MKTGNTFDILILLGRPAAGKSEIIHYLWNTDLRERTRRFHVAEFEEFDDFPMLWAWFEEDRILEELGRPRMHTTQDEYFKYPYLWDILIRMVGLEYSKCIAKNPRYHDRCTSIVEFSRGSEHGGYRRAFAHLGSDILERSAVMYINVSYAESLKKNRLRYNPKDPGSILQHSLPDEKMERLYKETDWESFTAADPEYTEVAVKQLPDGIKIPDGIRIPYAVFENEDDVTTDMTEELGRRLEETLGRLWDLYLKKQDMPTA